MLLISLSSNVKPQTITRTDADSLLLETFLHSSSFYWLEILLIFSVEILLILQRAMFYMIQ
jgi:hypothetical protein